MTNKLAYTLLTATFLSLTCALPVFAGSSTSSNSVVSSITQGLNQVANTANTLKSGVNSVSSTSKSTNSASSILSSANSYSNTLSSWTSSSNTSSIVSLTGDANKTISSIQGATKTASSIESSVSSLIKSGESLVDTVSDPQKLTQMAMNMAWSQIESVAENVASNLITDLFSTSGTGIPVTASTVTTQKTLAQVQKKLTSELEDKIAEEKDKVLDAIGGKPAVAADPQTGTQQTDSMQEDNPGRDNCPAYMAQFKPITNLAFDFVNENMIKDIESEDPGKVQTNWDQAVTYVKSTFYHDDEETLTPEINKELVKKRQDYLREINTNLLSVSIGMQQALIEDAKSISVAPTSGCGFIDDVNINTQTMIALVKQTMAEIALEIRLFELEAITEQAHQPVYLLPKPEDLSTDSEVESVIQTIQNLTDSGTSK